VLKPLLIAIGFLAPFIGAAWAQDMAGNTDFGRKTFKKCQSCHSIIKSDGQYIVKGGKLGPNLYGVIGRTAGTSDFRYGADLIMAGKMGLVWQVDTLSEYLTNPTTYLKKVTNNAGAKSKMSFKIGSGGTNLAAYLAWIAN